MECVYCGKEFTTDAALLQHCRDKHPNEKPPEIRAKTARAKDSKGSRRSLRRKNRHTRLYVALAIVALLSGAGIYSLSGVLTNQSGPYGTLPFPCTGAGATEHVHPYVRIVVNGQNVSIPADIGLINGAFCPLHTHDASGILHIESSSIGKITLGEFFQVWHATFGTVAINGVQEPVVFNSTDILGFKADATHKAILLVDGRPSTEWGSLILDQFDYCDASTTGTPCSPTAVGTPYWNGQQYPYGTQHTIVIEYVASS